MSPKHLYIIDGHAVLHRAWHALPPLATKDGRVVNAVYGFLTVLLKLIHEKKPTHLVVTFDMAAPTFRHKEYEEYKATREKQPDELYEQIPILKNVLEAMKIPIYEKEGFEADDVIGTIVTSVAKEGIKSTIVTGDLDALQLVSLETEVYTFARGISDSKIYDEKAVEDRYGLKPKQIIDLKALQGDVSDNIKGVKGIGTKTATELLQVFGSVEKIYEAIKNDSTELKKFRERVIALLKDGEKDAFDSKKLVTIVRDAPIEFNLLDAELESPDQEKITKIFADLGFLKLLDRISDNENKDVVETKVASKKIKAKTQTIFNINEAKELARGLVNEKEIAVRVFPRPESLYDKSWVGLVLVWGKNEHIVVPKEFVKEFKEVFKNKKIVKIGHDLKTDFHALAQLGLQFCGPHKDLMVASYLLNPGSRAHGLDALVLEYFERKLAPAQVQGTLLAPTLAQASVSATEESVYLPPLAVLIDKDLTERQQTKLFKDIETPLIEVLASMEQSGVKIDSDYLAEMGKQFKKRVAELSKKAYEMVGEEFNLNSPSQLKVMLFDKLGISAKVKKTAKGELSTAASELEKLRGEHPIIDLIFEHRELSKLLSTYVNALPELVSKESGRVHTTYNQTITSTGRLSSSNPNLQNIPIRKELGREIRKAFIASSGCELVAADYSQIELRMISEIAKVKRMQQAFRNKEDIHRATAAEVWNVELKDVTDKQRYAAKAINFGLLYGMGQNSLARATGMTTEEARDFIHRYFDVYPEIQEYVDGTKAAAIAQGYVETIFGRRRYLPELQSGMPMVRAAGERMAINAPVQGSAADIMKIAMVKVYDWVASEYGLDKKSEVKILMQVHDELVLEVKKDLVEKVGLKVKKIMEDVENFSVPIVVDVEHGKNWGEMVKL